jgi:thioredoxin-like negative regulator of GroEL
VSTNHSKDHKTATYNLPWPQELSQGLGPGLIWAGTSFFLFLINWVYGLFSVAAMFIFFQTQKSSPVGRARRFYVQGRLAYRNGELEKALDHFNQALQIKPDAAAIYPVVGDLYFSFGDVAKAKKAYQSYFQRKEQDHQMRIWYAGKFMELGEFDDAVKELKKLPADQKKETQVANLLAVSLLKINQPREAQQVLEPIVKKNKGAKEQELSARYFLAKANLLLGEKEKAITILQLLEQDRAGFEDVPEILNALTKKE